MKPRMPRGRTIQAAELVAQGKTHAEAAMELGISRQAVDKAVNSVLKYEAFDDQRSCRMLANARLNEIAERLREAGGLGPYRLRAVGKPIDVRALSALIKIEERRAAMFGYDAPQTAIPREANPFDHMTPLELFDECLRRHVAPPPGLKDLAKRENESKEPAENVGKPTQSTVQELKS